MNTTPAVTDRADLTAAWLLAALLGRLERSPQAVAASQYRAVVEHLRDELRRLPAGPGLTALLESHPAAAELYENLHYDHAGLCRSPLDWAMKAELQAGELIGRARARTPRPVGGSGSSPAA